MKEKECVVCGSLFKTKKATARVCGGPYGECSKEINRRAHFGKVPANKGKLLQEWQKQLIRETNTGRKQSPETIARRVVKLTGRKTGVFVECSQCKTSAYKYPKDMKRGTENYFCGMECKGLFFKGKSMSPQTQFKKGNAPWSTGKIIIREKHSGDFKKGQVAWNKGMKGLKLNDAFEKWRAAGGKVEKTGIYKDCLSCGEAFYVWKSKSLLRSNCSQKCRSKLVRETGELSGKNNPAWGGGKTKIQASIRGSTSYKEWRTSVFKRDGYKCTWCGNKKGANLEADHIIPFSILIFMHSIKSRAEADKCEELWSIENGRTLCRECHKKTDTYLSHEVRKITNGY